MGRNCKVNWWMVRRAYSNYLVFILLLYIIMAKIIVCIAPRLVKLELSEEFEKSKKEKFPSSYLAIHQKSDKQDDSWETIYNVGVYKQIGGYPVRWNENLNEILDFLGEQENMQIVDWDD